MIKVIVNGANGRMGQVSIAALSQASDFEVVAALGRDDNLATNIRTHHPDVVVDFTNAASGYDNACTIIANGARPVIGTTGFRPEQIQDLQQRALQQKLGGIIAPNFSLGIILLMRYAKDAARYFSAVEIIEMHHDKKHDAPSGTAIKTAEMIHAGKARPALTDSQHTLPGSRGANAHNIPIHAVRLPGLMAHETVMFGSQGETLTLRHDTINRECYMPGLLLACRKVLTLQEMVYGLENIMD